MHVAFYFLVVSTNEFFVASDTLLQLKAQAGFLDNVPGSEPFWAVIFSSLSSFVNQGKDIKIACKHARTRAPSRAGRGEDR